MGRGLEVTLLLEQRLASRTWSLHEVLAEDLDGDLAGGDLAGWRAYVAGPPVMVEAVAELLRTRGLPDDAVHSDPFLTEADRARPPRPAAPVAAAPQRAMAR